VGAHHEHGFLLAHLASFLDCASGLGLLGLGLLLVEQRGDDAAQVAAGGVLRLGRPASGHGRDDRQVLG
jgi:hypothetical protein